VATVLGLTREVGLIKNLLDLGKANEVTQKMSIRITFVCHFKSTRYQSNDFYSLSLGKSLKWSSRTFLATRWN